MTQRLYEEWQTKRTSKMSQIENYVSILIENNRVSCDELNILRKDKANLQGQFQLLMRDTLRLKEAHEEEVNHLKNNYSQQTGKLIEELKDILEQKQQMENSYHNILREITQQNKYQKESKTYESTQMERNYESQVRKLTEKLAEQTRQNEKKFYSNSENRLRLEQQIDKLNFEVNRMTKIGHQLEDEKQNLRQELIKASNLLKMSNKEKEELSLHLLKLQQQKNQSIIEMKKCNNSLKQELEICCENIRQLEGLMQTKSKQYTVLFQKNEHNRHDKYEFQQLYKSTAENLRQREEEFYSVNKEYTHLSEFSNKELKRMSELIRLLESDNTTILSDKERLEGQYKIQKQEIFTLLDRIKCLEQECESYTVQITQIKQANLELEKSNQLYKTEMQELELLNKSYNEKLMIQANHNATLQQIIQKSKKKNYHLQRNYTDLERIAKDSPTKITKKYQHEIHDIVRSNDTQKIEMTNKFMMQKEMISRVYEKALKEKQNMFKEKLSSLEREIYQINLK